MNDVMRQLEAVIDTIQGIEAALSMLSETQAALDSVLGSVTRSMDLLLATRVEGAPGVPLTIEETGEPEPAE